MNQHKIGTAPLFLKDLLQNKSYFSQTTNSFQLGILSANEWIGDEFLFFGDSQSVPYSITSTKPLLVYALSREDFYSKFSKEMQMFLEENAAHKCRWIEKRFFEILKNLNQLKDSYFEGITDKSSEVQKKFPRANSNALNTIRNKELVQGTVDVSMQQNPKVMEINQKIAAFDKFTKTDFIALDSIINGSKGVMSMPTSPHSNFNPNTSISL